MSNITEIKNKLEIAFEAINANNHLQYEVNQHLNPEYPTAQTADSGMGVVEKKQPSVDSNGLLPYLDYLADSIISAAETSRSQISKIQQSVYAIPSPELIKSY